MKIKKFIIIYVLILLTGLLLLPVHAEQEISVTLPVSESAAAPPAQAVSPKIPSPEAKDSDPAIIQQVVPVQGKGVPIAFIPEPEFEFATVIDGAKIIHDFIIQNHGAAPLIITVKTGCACAVAEHPRSIMPYDEGKITITIDTTGYGGRDNFLRTIKIFTNEKVSSNLQARIYGQIKDFAKFDPKKNIILRGKADQKIKSSVTITPQENYPFTITNYELDEALKDLVKIRLEQKDKKYVLTAENQMDKPIRYMGKIHLHTDSSHKPQINMIIRGIIE